MFSIEDIRSMTAQYNLGRSDGTSKAAHRDKAGGAFVEFYQEGYDDAVGGLRVGLPRQKAEWVGARGEESDDLSLGKRQVLFALRSAVEAEKSGSPAAVLGRVNLMGERIMGDRRGFFASSEACPLVKGAEPDRPGAGEPDGSEP